MAPADDALKLIDNSKTQKNLSSETNLSDIVGDLSQSNKSLDMIPEKSQSHNVIVVAVAEGDNNNFIETKNVTCIQNFTELHKHQQQLNTMDVGSSASSASSSSSSSTEILQQEIKNKKLVKEIDELAKIYHEEHNEMLRASCTDRHDVVNTNTIYNNNNNNDDDDKADDADDEDEFERVFEDSMHNLEKNLDNYESSSSSNEESDYEYCDKIPKSPISSSIIGDVIIEQKRKTGNIYQNIITALPCINPSGGISIKSPPIKIASKNQNKNIRIKNDNIKENESDISDSDEDSPDKIMNEIAKSPKLLPNEILNNHNKLFLFRPYSLPFQERRRLSQCKEEDENEDSDNNKLPSQKSDSAVGSNISTGNDSSNHSHSSRRDRNFHAYIRSPPVPESQLMSEKFKELERLRDQFRRKLEEIHPSTIAAIALTETSDNTKSQISTNNPNPKVYKGKFVVTRAEDQMSPSSQQTPTNINNDKNDETAEKENVPILRSEAVKLRNLQPQMNSFTIHFPNSKGISGHTRIQSLFSSKIGGSEDDINDNNNGGDLKRHTVTFQPHLDKKFFDTSLVEIRPISDSTKSLDNCDSVKKPNTDDVSSIWIPRPSNKVTPASSKNSVDDPDGSKSTGSSRPSSAPAEPNAKAARKASKKMEKEAKRQEKELRNKEKEARKIERETARRLEREQAKLEKLNRNSEKIARSTERLAPRSGSLERRRSGEDSPVLNQSTVHGIASPNRRPTIFDVFRPRTKSDAKRKEKDAALHSGSEKDNSSTSSNHSGSGGIMKAVKHVVQNTVGHHRHHNQSTATTTAAATTTTTTTTEKPSVKYRDGSAHPHAGSDAQYYHTVTAVRRADVSRSPMTKVMDLFRYRSNSAVNEADKRKARAAAHQQLLAAQTILSRKNLLSEDVLRYLDEEDSDDPGIDFYGCDSDKDDNYMPLVDEPILSDEDDEVFQMDV